MANEKTRLRRARDTVASVFKSFGDNVISPIWNFVTYPFRAVARFVGLTKSETSADAPVETQASAIPTVAAQSRFPRVSNFFAGLNNPFAGIGARIGSWFKPKVAPTETDGARLEREKQAALANAPTQAVVEETDAEREARLESEKQAELAIAPAQTVVEETDAEREARLESEKQAALASKTTEMPKAANDGKRTSVVSKLNGARKDLGLTGYRMHKLVYGEKAKAATTQQQMKEEEQVEQRQGSGSKLRLGGGSNGGQD